MVLQPRLTQVMERRDREAVADRRVVEEVEVEAVVEARGERDGQSVRSHFFRC